MLIARFLAGDLPLDWQIRIETSIDIPQDTDGWTGATVAHCDQSRCLANDRLVDRGNKDRIEFESFGLVDGHDAHDAFGLSSDACRGESIDKLMDQRLLGGIESVRFVDQLQQSLLIAHGAKGCKMVDQRADGSTEAQRIESIAKIRRDACSIA